MKNKKFSKKFSGFTLIEISIVIMVIAVVIIAAIAASRLLGEMALTSARSVTKSNSVNYLRRNMVLWLDTVSEASFRSTEAVDGTAVSVWYETNPNANQSTASQSTSANKPTYVANAINGLPALSFDGTNDSMTISGPYTPSSFPSLFNTFSIFVVAQPTATVTSDTEATSGTTGQSGQKYLMYPSDGDATYASISGAAGVGISFGSNGVGVYENATSYTAPLLFSSTGYTAPVVLLVEYSSNTPTLYKNGTSVRTGQTSTKSYIYPSNVIGGGSYGYFKGYIGEIIVLDKVLSAEEKADVFAYLKKKWKTS